MKYLRHWRKLAGHTQEELARELEITDRTIRLWEASTREPRAPDIKKLCEALHVTESELLNGPQSKEISVKLILGKIEEMNKMTIDVANNDFKLIMDGNALGIGGIAEFKDDDEFENILAKIESELRRGWRFIKEGRK